MIRGQRDRQPGELTVFATCKDLIRYTRKITDNPSRFPKRIRFSVTNRLQDKVFLMYEKLIEAGEIEPFDALDLRGRETLQRQTLALSKSVAALIEDSLEEGRIDEDSAGYWAGLVEEVQSGTRVWMDSDRKKFSHL